MIIYLKRILLISMKFSNKNLKKLFCNNINKNINVCVLFILITANDKESKKALLFCYQDLADTRVK